MVASLVDTDYIDKTAYVSGDVCVTGSAADLFDANIRGHTPEVAEFMWTCHGSGVAKGAGCVVTDVSAEVRRSDGFPVDSIDSRRCADFMKPNKCVSEVST